MPENDSASAPETSVHVRFPLRRKLAAMALCISVVPLAILALLLIEVNATAVEESSLSLRAAVADDLANTIEQDLTAAEDGLVAVASALASQGGPERLEMAMTLVATNSYLDHAAIYALDGSYIDAMRVQGFADAEFPKQLDDDIKELAIGLGVYHGPLIEFAGSKRVVTVVPLKSDDSVTGFAWSAVDLAPVQARVDHLAQNHLMADGDELFVVDNNLHFAAHSDANKGQGLQVAPSEGILVDIDKAAIDKKLAKTMEYEFEGRWHVGTLASVESRPWLIGVQIPRDVAYASLVKMRQYVIGGTIATGLLALLAGLWMAGALTKPLDALTRFAAVLAERRFGETLKVDSGDELALLGAAMSNASVQLESSEKRIAKQIEIRNDLGRYLPAEIVEQVVARKQDMALGGTRREITVMFADVVAFTPLTDKLSAEQVVQILNELFTICTEIIFRHQGTVDKFIGDCVMAMWGAPKPQEDHAALALAAAEEILSWLEFGNDRWREDFGVSVQVAIGINTGEAVVGNIGSETRMEYTAIGDAVNVAARLESIARPQQILITKRTADMAGDGFTLVPLGTRTLSGRKDDIELYEVRT